MNKPFRVVVDKTGIVPVTPREAADGFDRCVEVEYHAEGRPAVPTNWHTISDGPQGLTGKLEYGRPARPLNNFNSRHLPYLQYQFRYGQKPGEFINRYLLRLADVPLKEGAITLKAKTSISSIFKESPNAYLSSRSQISVQVRKSGESVQEPQVSHYFPRVAKVLVQDLTFDAISGADYKSGDIMVRIFFEKDVSVDTATLEYARGEITDETGRTYSFDFSGRGISSPSIDIYSGVIAKADQGKSCFIHTVVLNLSSIPARAGALTLKYRAIWGKYWPLPISIRLRDHGAANCYAIGQKQPVLLKPGSPRLSN